MSSWFSANKKYIWVALGGMLLALILIAYSTCGNTATGDPEKPTITEPSKGEKSKGEAKGHDKEMPEKSKGKAKGHE